MSAAKRPLSLALAALGGQGGGVVSGWLTAVARREGYLVQATSVPGVAQRTGATLYYLEFFAEADLPADGRRPIMALMPSPGDVDVVVATELVEAGRAIARGLVTPDRTTLITSTHRAYTISEKSDLGDGRVDSAAIMAEAQRCARSLATVDMAALAERHGAIISSVILGAIAGAAGLPFAPDSYRQAIRDGGIAVATNLAAFDASLDRARSGTDLGATAAGAVPAATAIPAALLERIRASFPAAARSTLEHGVARLIDYQDGAYAGEYLDRVARITALEPPHCRDPRLTEAVARGLALWMSIEDPIRVAQLKIRPERLATIRRDVRAAPGQIVEVREFLKPRVEEICGTLPAGMGRRLLQSAAWRRRLERFAAARTVRTTSVGGFLLLRSVAALKRWRRGTLRFALERVEIDAWLAAVAELASRDYEVAVELADSQRLVKGYGDTYERGLRNFRQITAAARRLAGRDGAAALIARLRRAAQADERSEAFGRELAALG
jgi:indolepyruvate ferredoxin oxidoreductase, beta subunit